MLYHHTQQNQAVEVYRHPMLPFPHEAANHRMKKNPTWLIRFCWHPKSIIHGYINGSFPLTTFPPGNRPVCQKKTDTGNSGIGISAHNVRNHVNPSQWPYPLLSVSEKDNGTRLYQALLPVLTDVSLPETLNI